MSVVGTLVVFAIAAVFFATLVLTAVALTKFIGWGSSRLGVRIAEPWGSIAGFAAAVGVLGALSGRPSPWTAVACVAGYAGARLAAWWWQRRIVAE